MLKSNILTLSLSSPLDMLTVQRNFVSHNYSAGVVVVLSLLVADVCTAKARLEERRR
jgi:hypothetical protein